MQPKRLGDRIGTQEIIEELNISLNSFYRKYKKGIFDGYIFKDTATGWYYYTTPEKLMKLAAKLQNRR